MFKADNWTGEKEQKFDDVCAQIVSALAALDSFRKFVGEAKTKKPILHFVATVGTLFFLAWLGNTVNNFFLLYLVTMAVAMLPGLHRRGLLKKVFANVTLKVSEVVRGKDHLKKAE